MKLLTILIILSLCSCGTDSSSGGSSASPAASTTPNLSTSYYAATASALMACNDASRGFLAYIEDTAKFEACLAAGWSVVNVNGKDGSSGTSGTNGTNGSMVSGNQWYDPITTKMWVMTTINSTITSWNNSMTACTGSYRMPISSEIVIALTHGMKAEAQALINAPTFILASDGNPYTVNAGTQGSSATAAQFCISN